MQAVLCWHSSAAHAVILCSGRPVLGLDPQGWPPGGSNLLPTERPQQTSLVQWPVYGTGISFTLHLPDYKVYRNPGLSSSVWSCMPISTAAASLVCPAASRTLLDRAMYRYSNTTIANLTEYPTSIAMYALWYSAKRDKLLALAGSRKEADTYELRCR